MEGSICSGNLEERKFKKSGQLLTNKFIQSSIQIPEEADTGKIGKQSGPSDI